MPKSTAPQITNTPAQAVAAHHPMRIFAIVRLPQDPLLHKKISKPSELRGQLHSYQRLRIACPIFILLAAFRDNGSQGRLGRAVESIESIDGALIQLCAFSSCTFHSENFALGTHTIQVIGYLQSSPFSNCDESQIVTVTVVP